MSTPLAKGTHSETDNSGATTSSSPAAFDEDRYHVLVEYLPEPVRDKIKRAVRKAKHYFRTERHYEVVQVVDRVLAQCDRTAQRMPVSLEGDLVENRVRVITHGTPTPTVLSTLLLRRFLQQSAMYTIAKEKSRACDQLVTDIDDVAGWTPVNVDKDGVCGTFYRYDSTTDHHFFKVIGEMDVNVIYVVGVIMELDLFSQWFPLCAFSKDQGGTSRFHKASYFVVKCPWPLVDREVFLEGFGIDDLEQNGRVLIVASSVDETAQAVKPGIVPPPHSNNVRCNVHYGGFQIQMRGPAKTRLSFVMSVDPKIPNIPQKAMNWISGKVMAQMLEDIHKAAISSMDRSSVYYARRRARPDVYDLFRARYNETLQKKAPNEYEKHRLPEDY